MEATLSLLMQDGATFIELEVEEHMPEDVLQVLTIDAEVVVVGLVVRPAEVERGALLRDFDAV